MINNIKWVNDINTGNRFDVVKMLINGVWVEDELNKKIRLALK